MVGQLLCDPLLAFCGGLNFQFRDGFHFLVFCSESQCRVEKIAADCIKPDTGVVFEQSTVRTVCQSYPVDEHLDSSDRDIWFLS
jgi:hypothetical protein